MKNILANAASILALIPGLATLLSDAPVPQEARWLFCMLAEGIGILTILVIRRYKDTIANWPTSIVSGSSILLFSAGVFLALVYFFVFSHCSTPATGDFRGQGTVFFPFWLEGDIAKLAEKMDWDRAKVVGTFGPADINERLSNQGVTVAKSVTFLVFLICYEGIFVCWTVAFCILSLRE